MTTARIASLGYHDVTDDRHASGFQRPAAWDYKVGRRIFDDHLWAMAAAGQDASLVDEINWNAVDARLLLTFDDGGASATYIGDTLRRHGWCGHFFVVTSLLGTRGFLDAAGVRTLRAQGHLVGSHSHTHPDIFRDLPAARMAEEWRVSRERLENILGEPCATASVPGGDISPRVLQSAAEAGFGYLFTSEPDPRPEVVSGCRVLGRFVVKADTPVARVTQFAQLEGWRGALMLRRLRVAASRALPTLYRHYVAARTRATHES